KEAARRQAEVAERLSHVQAPLQQARLEKTQDAVQQALADLMDARPQDVTASQESARRQLERLEQALRGEKPADEQARELAKLQEELTKDAAKMAADPAAATPERKAALERKQQEIAQKTRDLAAPEAPQRQAEAVDATRKAEELTKANVPN